MGGMAAVLALPLLQQVPPPPHCPDCTLEALGETARAMPMYKIALLQEWPGSRVSIISDRSFDSFGAAM